MKTKNAFAFRNFDSERILQRPYFKVFRFTPDKTDAEILKSLDAAAEDSSVELEKKLNKIENIFDKLVDFSRLISRHLSRYTKYIRRTNKFCNSAVVEYFTANVNLSELKSRVSALYDEIEKKVQASYGREFASRLRQARTAAGLTQKQLGDMIRISPNRYNHYESGKREPSISILCRLLKIFSAEQLFGQK